MITSVDNRPTTASAKNTTKAVGEAAAEAVRAVGDDLKLSHNTVTPERVEKAFKRLDKAEAMAQRQSLGTLGMLPVFREVTLKEVEAAKEALEALRSRAPELVAAEERSRAAETRKGTFDFVKKWFLFPLAPVPVMVWNRFGKKD